jgi:tetratricopeptide (TPR) repeat protein
MMAVYDMSVSPASFDLATFLALADHRRNCIGKEAMHVLFVPADGTGLWENEAIDLAQRQWRLRNLLVPLCWLWSSCRAVTVLSSRAEAAKWLKTAGRHDVFPVGYRLASPTADAYQWAHAVAEHACGERVPAWRAPDQARRFVADWLAANAGDRRVVVVTLREGDYYSEINSDLDEWAAFARSLDASRYCVIVLRDTAAAFATVPAALRGLTSFPEASINVEIRAALYEQSFLCLSVGTGPMMLQWLNPSCRCIIFNLLNPSNFRSTATSLRALGLEIGGQLSTGSRFHRLVWERDSAAAISREFRRMVEVIEPTENAAADTPDAEREPPLRVARRLRETARWTAAHRIYRHLLGRPQERVAAYYGLSNVEMETPRRFRLERYARAFRFYFVARVLRPGLGWSTVDEALEIAHARQRWRDGKGASAIYRAVLEVSPNPEALDRLGVMAMRKGDVEEAARLIGRAIAEDPFTARYHLDLAEAMAKLGRTADAEHHYRAAISCDATNEEAREKLRGSASVTEVAG